MSSKFRPLSLFGSYNNRLPHGKINDTKGSGINSYPIATIAKNVRGYSNKDYSNESTVGFGKARPIKHYRKGRVFQQVITKEDGSLYDLNEMRIVRSSTTPNLVSSLIDTPNSFSVKENYSGQTTTKDCLLCNTGFIITDMNYDPTNLSENPSTTLNQNYCYSKVKHAKQRVLSPSTNIDKKYYTTTKEYLRSRCKLYEQRNFNYSRGTTLTKEIADEISSVLVNTPSNVLEEKIKTAKPGEPLSYFNLYVAQCQPLTEIYNSSIQAICYELILLLFKETMITDEEYIEMNSSSIATKDILSLIEYVNNNFSESRSSTIEDYIYYILSRNKVLQEFISKKPDCGRVYYKPSNPKFSVQGAVPSSNLIFHMKQRRN